MPSDTRHKWIFRARFRRHSFGWRSQPAIKRIKEAVSEIRKATRKDPVLGAEGVVLFLEKVSPAIEANQKNTCRATFRAIIKKYSNKMPVDIWEDLVAGTPNNEGKWFAAAKSVGLYTQAIEVANRIPCDPRTLTRATRDMAEVEPKFAVEAGIAALRWLI